MFENIKNKLKDIYYTIYAKRYISTRQRNSSESQISTEVLPEEVKYKILEKGLITEPKEEIYAMIASLRSEERRNEMIEKYISINAETPIREIVQIPEILRNHCLGNNKLMQLFLSSDIVEILKNTTDINMCKLLINNPSIVNLLNNGKFYYSEYTDEETLWYYLYKRISQIDDESLKESVYQLIDVEELKKKIDTTLLSNEELAVKNIKLLIDEHNKIDILLKAFLTTSYPDVFYENYRELSEEAKQEILSKIFSKQYVEQLEEIYKEKIKQKLERNIDFGILLKQYEHKEEIDQELLMRLFKINKEGNLHGLARGRIDILSLLEDANKAKVLCDVTNFSEFYTMLKQQLELFNGIESDDIFANALDVFIRNYESGKVEYVLELDTIEEYIISIEDERRLAIIQKQGTLDEKNQLLMELSLFHMQNKECIKEALKCELIAKTNLSKRKNEKQEMQEERIKDTILLKILEYGNTDELLRETNISEVSEEIACTILLNANREVVDEFLEKTENINPNIRYILQNKFEEMKRLVKEIDNLQELKEFFRQVISEDVKKIDDKLDILLYLQKRHSEIAATIKFPMLEKDIIDIFGGIENLEMILRYPKTQEQLLNLRKEELRCVVCCYNIFKEKFNNPDYLLNEMLEEFNGFGNYIVYDEISRFLSEGKDITEDDKENIANMVLSNDIIKQCWGLINDDFDVKKYKQIKAQYCDSIISGENTENNLGIKGAYLLRYYNMSIEEARIRVKEYEKLIDNLDSTPENIPIKNYINALKNILECNTEILSAAYNISRDEEEISRLDIEIMEEQIRERIGSQLKETLFKTDQKEVSDTIQVMLDDKQVDVNIYEPDEEFNMLVHVLDAYGGGNGEYSDYEKQWNTTKYARNQRICTSYIGNNNMAIVKRHNCVIYGFSQFADAAFVKEAPYDIVSINNEIVTTSKREAYYLMPEDLIRTTRRYNEVDIERQDFDNPGQKLQPSYIICFGKNKEDIEEESKRAAAQFGIPIILIDREKVAQRELEKINEKLKRFEETKDPNLISEIIEQYCNNKAGSGTTIKDKKDIRAGQGIEEADIEQIYFSDESLKQIINRFLQVADQEKNIGNFEIAERIMKSLNLAMKEENDKDYLWQKKFGILEISGIFDSEIFKEERKRVAYLRPQKNVHIQTLIKQIKNEETQEEYEKQKEEVPEDQYDIDDLKEKIDDLSVEEKELLEQEEPYWNLYNLALEKKTKKLYVLLLKKELGIKKISSKILIECVVGGKYGKRNEKIFSEEELNLIQALTDFSLKTKGPERYKDLIDKYQISEELQEEFVKAVDILTDVHLLKAIASSSQKTVINPRPYKTEIGKRYIKTALQIQESEALKKIDTIIAQEGYEEQKEIILSYISKGRTPIEIAQGLHEVSKKPKIKESNDDGER